METLFPRMTREKALLQPPLRQSAMKTGLLFFLLTYGFRDHSVAHYAPVQETAGAEYYHQQWRYYPSYTVGGFQYPYPHSGTCGYTCHSHHYVPPYPGGRYHAAYPHPPPPPPPPPASSVPQFGQPGFTGPWVPGPVIPPPPTPRNLDPFPGKFLGMGSVRYINGGRDVELLCNFQEVKLVSNVVWVKAKNTQRYPPPWNHGHHGHHHHHHHHDGGGSGPPYGYPFPGGHSYVPSVTPTCGTCFCPIRICTYHPVDLGDRRFFAASQGSQATLLIYGVMPEDRGIYRCSATSSVSRSSAGDTETVYQIVDFSG